jgi:putative membrane protein
MRARFLMEKIMRRRLTFGFFIGFLGVSLFGCSTRPSDMTSTDRDQPNINNRTNANTVTGVGSNTNDATNMRSDTKTGDTGFLTEAAQGGMAEVELGKLASTKATNPDVKKFAQQMITDHSKANNELKELAAKKNFSVPTELSPKHKSLMDKLNGLSGADFDKAYVDAMVDDHKEDVEAFKDQSEDGKDADVKAWAGKTLPTLQMHLDMIKGIQSKMK